jgi:hypothetical protein
LPFTGLNDPCAVAVGTAGAVYVADRKVPANQFERTACPGELALDERTRPRMRADITTPVPRSKSNRVDSAGLSGSRGSCLRMSAISSRHRCSRIRSGVPRARNPHTAP